MLTFTQIASSLTPVEAETIQNLLLALPKAAYSSISSSESYIITRDHAQRIMRVTNPRDYENLLEKFVWWNTLAKSVQTYHDNANDFCEISAGLVGGQMYISIHRMSDTESVHLTLQHDSEHVMMDIQL